MSYAVRLQLMIMSLVLTTSISWAADCDDATARFEEAVQEFRVVGNEIKSLKDECTLAWSKKTYSALKAYDKYIDSVREAHKCGVDIRMPISTYQERHNRAVEEYHDFKYKCEITQNVDLNPELPDEPKQSSKTNGQDACVGIGLIKTVMCVGPGRGCQCIHITNTCNYPISVFFIVDGNERSFSLQAGEGNDEACTTEMGQTVKYSRFKPWAGYPK